MKKAFQLTLAFTLFSVTTPQFAGLTQTKPHTQPPGADYWVINDPVQKIPVPISSDQCPGRRNNDQMAPGKYLASPIMPGKNPGRYELPAGVDTAWVRYYSSQVFGGEDQATAMTIDDSGNVYITGTSEGMNVGSDFATIKYNAFGVRQWVAVYTGPTMLTNHACAVAVDVFGQVYVTGTSLSQESEEDITTVKYNSTGVEQWVARYNGPANRTDDARGLVVDGRGNVYVTGSSSASGIDNDYVTIKYDSGGGEQWVARYTGPDPSVDNPSNLAIDPDGNVYVTGMTASLSVIPLNYHFATVKYNPNGVEQWVTCYNGSGNQNDWAKDLAVDAFGNVYVTGTSRGDGTGSDYVTVKYNSAGGEQWVVRYDGPGNYNDEANALIIDTGGNVYVTGSSSGYHTGYDFATIKYNSDGIEQWVARYNMPEGMADYARDLDVDKAGNVYVTGWSSSLANGGRNEVFVTLKYNPEGVEQWVVQYDPPLTDNDIPIAIAVDPADNVYIAGTIGNTELGASPPNRSHDYAIIKYNTSGEEQWTAIYNGPKIDHNYANNLVVDAWQNVYVSGYSGNDAKKMDYLILKYDAAGAMLWMDRCQEGSLGTRLMVDGAGNAYLTGFGNEGGYLTIKYNANGVRQWVAHFNENVASLSPRRAFPGEIYLAVDGSGNVYLAGSLKITNENTDFVTIKYDSSGNEQWVVTYDCPDQYIDKARALAVDDSGNVYVTGTCQGNGAEIVTIKYNHLGIGQWVTRFDGPGAGSDKKWDWAVDMALDQNGGVYVTGRTRTSETDEDFVTIKYDANGIQQWATLYNSQPDAWDEPTAIVLDDAGNIYVTGESNGQCATVKYDNSGVQQWVAGYHNCPGRNEPYDLTVDATGNVFVTGFCFSSSKNMDFLTIKYDALGAEQWSVQYDGAGNTTDDAQCIAVDPYGSVYITGNNLGSNWSTITTIKYTETGTAVFASHEPGISPGKCSLKQNYPNPFNPATTIEFSLLQSAFVTLKVYNLLGEEVATLVAEQRTAGIHRFNWDASPASGGQGLASGVYLYRLEAGDPSTSSGQGFVQTKRLVLMR